MLRDILLIHLNLGLMDSNQNLNSYATPPIIILKLQRILVAKVLCKIF